MAKNKITEKEVFALLKKIFGEENFVRLSGVPFRGCPDFLFRVPPERGFVFAELKIENDRLKKVQRKFLEKHGGWVFRVRVDAFGQVKVEKTEVKRVGKKC